MAESVSGVSNGGKKKKIKKKKERKHPKLWLTLKIILLVFLVTSIVAALFLYFRYGKEIMAARDEAKRIVAESNEDTFRASETSVVYDSKGKQITILKAEKDVYYVPLSEIPQQAIDAMIVTEDKKFFRHNGIDLKAIGAAFIALVKHNGEIKRGASTITQQLARNIFLSTEQTLNRKVKEIFIALELEKKYSKEQILEFYFNNIYFANGYYGIEAASKGYFNKSCKELNTAQIAFICSIPNSPTRYDPIENKQNTLERKNRILDQMLADGKITDVEYSEAYNYEIELNVPKPKKRNFVETYAQNCAIKTLMKIDGFEFRNIFNDENDEEEYNELYNDTYSKCQQALFREGYRIYTSIDMKKQKELQKAINEELRFSKGKNKDGIYKFQGAGVCIDNNNGNVIAVVGGRSQNVTGYTFNRAYQSYRQPGSSIKPLIIYTPYFERDHTPNDIVRDVPIKDGPKNSHGSYMGNISVRTAVEQSVNTVAWSLFEEMTPELCLNYLNRMKFSRITRSDYTQSASLGGLTHGVSPVEMASAYAAIANEGVFREPSCIVTITDSKGNVIYDDSMRYCEQVYDSNAAAMMTDVLEGVLTKGTGRGYALEDMACAGKTGTTNDKKDGWFVGFTPYYTTAIWVGYDIPKSVDDLLGNTYPIRIWKNYMSEIHDGLENIEFPEYEGEQKTTYHAPSATKKPSVTKEPKEEKIDNEPDNMDEFDYVPDDSDDTDNSDDGSKDNNETQQNAPQDVPQDNTLVQQEPDVVITEPPAAPEPVPEQPAADDNPPPVDNSEPVAPDTNELQ